MNIPNSLTILRILLIPVYVGFMTYGRYGAGLVTLLWLLASPGHALAGAMAGLAVAIPNAFFGCLLTANPAVCATPSAFTDSAAATPH